MRGKRRKAVAVGDTPPAPGRRDDEFTRRACLNSAKLIRRVYEVDPLLCPFCGAKMKILAFILDPNTARALRGAQDLPGGVYTSSGHHARV